MTAKPVVTQVEISRQAIRQLRKLPKHIQRSLAEWVDTVERIGIRRSRMVKGNHDEPLMGSRVGQRSVRLNRSYRAIYIEGAGGLKLLVIEVNKHEY